MLIITRKVGEEIVLDGEIRIFIKEVKGKQVRIGVEAPPTVAIHRGEIYREVADENARAAVTDVTLARKAAEDLRIILGKDDRQS